MAEITMDTLNEAREIIRDATAQIVDTHDEIDLCWLRANNTIEGRKKKLLQIVNGIDDDIRTLRNMQKQVREMLGATVEEPKPLRKPKASDLVTADMVKRGIEKGIVQISDDLECYGVIGTGCKIGDNGFYFKDNDEEVAEEDVPKRIAEAINDMITEEFEDNDLGEGWLYKLMLEEA